YSVASGKAGSDAIWSFSPTGTGQTIAALGGFSSAIDVVIQTGNTVTTYNSTEITAKNLTVQTGAVLKGLTGFAGHLTPFYVYVYGDLTVDGQLGTTGGLDSIALNMEGLSQTISGNGSIDIQRMRKNKHDNTTTTVTVARNMNFWYPNTALYNNYAGASTFNVNVNAGVTLNFEGKGDLAMDGTDGSTVTNRGGVVTVYGSITNVDTVYAFSNTSSGTSIGITIKSGGLISANRVMTGLGNGTSGAKNFFFDVQSGGELDIYTALELQSGNFAPSGTVLFKSTSSTQIAYLDNFSTGFSGTYTGQISAERYFDAASTANQHFMGSPVHNTPMSQFGASGTAGWIIPTNSCDEQHSAGNSPYGSVFSYHESHGAGCAMAQWKVETSGNMADAQGYSILKSGAGVVTVTGTPNLNSSYPLSGLTNSAWPVNYSRQGRPMGPGWQLVANPYLATLKLTSGQSGFDGQVQVWQTEGPHAGSYQPGIGNTQSPVYIAPFQAFMVKVTSGSATYSLNASDRVTQAQQFYSTSSDRLQITAENTANGLLDETVVAFDQNATDTFDTQFDANKFGGSLNRHTLYTLNNNTWMAINTLKDINTTSTVPVGFEPGVSGNYTFSFTGDNTFDPTSYIYLEDIKTGTMHDVRSGIYSFTADAADNWERFVLHFTPPAQINTGLATCSTPGTISITQPGSADWSYTITDNNGAVIANGQLNSHNPVNIQAQAGDYTLTLTDANNYTVTKAVTVGGAQDVTASFNTSTNNATVQTPVSFTSTSSNASNYS
ncbi:MAG TPA: hypothetical protein VG603_08025, partial [Chitinophagales bacterium]|nr:hypothetical protein [Chitinophagales bacterium]